jgi:hypothetical protein
VPRRRFDAHAVTDALMLREQVLSHSDLRTLGMHPATITRWIGPGGPWQRLLPGVVLAHRGTPTRRELMLAALSYAKDGAVITGVDAIRAQGGTQRGQPIVHVLTPIERQRASFGFVRIERTRRLPPPALRRGLPFAPVPRATIDACRYLESLSAVRDLTASVVQQRLCDAPSLVAEVRAGARQRTALSRRVLGEVSDGVRSVAEAHARDILARNGIPGPLWNITLMDAEGVPILTPDGFWPDYCAALEIDSLAWHFQPSHWRRTQQRQRLFATIGVPVLTFSPTEILADPAGFSAQTAAFLRRLGRREMPSELSYRRSA